MKHPATKHAYANAFAHGFLSVVTLGAVSSSQLYAGTSTLTYTPPKRTAPRGIAADFSAVASDFSRAVRKLNSNEGKN